MTTGLEPLTRVGFNGIAAASTLAQITSNQNNYSLGTGSNFRISSDALRTITGISAGANGRAVFLTNVGTKNILLAHESTSSTAANRIVTAIGQSFALIPGGVAGLLYDSTTTRWRVFTDPRANAHLANIRDFGAVCDGTVDDATAVQGAVTAAEAVNGTVMIPSTTTGTAVGSTIAITAPIRFIGEGGGTPNWGDFTGGCAGAGCFTATQPKGPRLIWTGGASSMFTVTALFGFQMENIVLDGADDATTGLLLDRVRHSRFSHVGVIRVDGVALHLGSTSTAGGSSTADGTFDNAFYQCFFHGPQGILIDKIGSGITGGYHNRFYGCLSHFTGNSSTTNYGLKIISGDNNSFYGLRSQNVSGTSDAAVILGSSVTTAGGSTLDSLKAYNNYFYHLQCPQARVYALEDAKYAGVIYGYDAANTSLLPSEGTNSGLTFLIDAASAPTTNAGLWKVRASIIATRGRGSGLGSITGATTLNPGEYAAASVSGTFTLTIPLSADYVRFECFLTNIGGGTVTLSRSGSDVFHGRGASSATTFSLTSGNSVRIQADGGSAWLVF